MSKYIDADLLFETIQRRVSNSAIRSWLGAIINEIPPVEVKTEKHGKWIDIGEEDLSYENVYACSVCNSWFYIGEDTPENNDHNYCPNCGARMDVTENEA